MATLKHADRPDERDVEPLNDLLNTVYPGYDALSQTSAFEYKTPSKESIEQEKFRFEPSFFKGQILEKVMTIAAKVTGYSWNTIRSFWDGYGYSPPEYYLRDALGLRLNLLEQLANRFINYNNGYFGNIYFDSEKVIDIVNRKFPEEAYNALSNYLPYVLSDYRLPENPEKVAIWLADEDRSGDNLTTTG